MKKTIFGVFICMVGCSFALADTCHNNICIDTKGNTYIKNNTNITNELMYGLSGVLLSGNTQTGTLHTGNVQTGALLSGSILTGKNTITTGTTNALTNFKPTGSNTSGATQLDEAILRGYHNGLTMHLTIKDFNAEWALLREDSSKLLYQAARTLGYKADTFNDCNFTDLEKVSSSLKQNIADICKAGGLMKGDKGEFFPLRKLTNAEAITVIARITGIKDTNSSSAWWTPYLNHVKKLNILNGMNIDEHTMDSSISRGDLIILLHRLGKLYDKHYGDFSQVINTNTINQPGTSNSQVSVGVGIVDTPRFTSALLWMYNNDMTIYWKASDYDPFNVMTREQAAKVLSTYRKKFITTPKNTVICKYTDIATSNLKSHIEDVCNYGIFANTTTFDPTYNITKVDFVRALLSLQGTLANDSNTATVIEKGLEAELITSSDLATFDKPITRYEVALMLHTLYLKNTFITNISNNNSVYYVISPTTDQISGAVNEQKTFIDINTIDSKDFNNGYVNLFGNLYKINKKETINYFPTSYSWYGTISDINTDTSIGTITMAVGQKAGTKIVVEGFITFPNTDTIYTITPTTTVPYYTIKKIK